MEGFSESLSPHEWLIVALFCLILFLLSLHALFAPPPAVSQVDPIWRSQMAMGVEIEVTGAVDRPGFYSFDRTPTYKAILEKAHPLPTADLSQIELKGIPPLCCGQIEIPFRRPIVIQLKGAVDPEGAMEILSGTRVCEIVGEFPLLPDADISALRKNKTFIQEGDVIAVPFKARANLRLPKRGL